MFRLFQKLFDVVLAGSLKKILLGAGIGVASGVIFFKILNYYIDKLVNSLSYFGTAGEFGIIAINLFGLAGLDIAMSIIIGAYVVKFTIKKTQIFLKANK